MRDHLVMKLVVLVAVFATSWALFTTHFFPLHDYVHVARIVQMAKSLIEGQLPVRWSDLFGYGYGMPLFEFYGPLPYYLGAVLYLFNLPPLFVLRVLFIICSALTAVGGYLLGKRVFNSNQVAALSALAITLAPYRSVNLYIRGAVGESWGIMAMPWVLWAISGLWKQKKHSLIALTLSLSVLFLSHNLVTFIAAPFFGLWFIGYGWISTRSWQDWRRAFFQACAAVGLAVGLTAFYLFPAFLEKENTQVAQLITNGYFDYHLHFLYLRQYLNPVWGYGGSEWGPQDKISFFLGWGQIAGLVLALSLIAKTLINRSVSKHKSIIQLVILSFGLAGVSLLMATFKFQFIWDATPLFTFVQFPWRYVSIGLVFIGLAAASSVVFIPSKYRNQAAIGLSLLMLLNGWYFRPEKYLDTPDGLYYTDQQRITTEMSGILPDFIPNTAPASRADQPNLGVALVCQIDNSCSFQEETLSLLGHQKLISINPDQTYQVVFATNYFPGWSAEVNGKSVPLEMTENGLIGVTVPEGKHIVGIKFGSTPVRTVSDTTSLVSIFILVVIALMGLL